jgi:hypothetical protein
MTPEYEAVLFGRDQLEERCPPFPSRHRPRISLRKS